LVRVDNITRAVARLRPQNEFLGRNLVGGLNTRGGGGWLVWDENAPRLWRRGRPQ